MSESKERFSLENRNETIQTKEGAFALFLAVLSFICVMSIFGMFLNLFGPDNIDQQGIANRIIGFISNRMSGENIASYEISALVATVITLAIFVIIYFWGKQKARAYFRSGYSFKSMRSRYGSAYGTAELGNVYDLKKLTGSNGLIVGYNHKKKIKISEKVACEHLAVIGPTGCGKTAGYFIPNLLDLPDGVSVVATDPKGEIAKVTGDTLEKRGWDVCIVSLEEDSISDKYYAYNPLAVTRNETELSELSEIILLNGYNSMGQGGDIQWVNFSQPLWEAALIAEKRRSEIGGDVPTITNAGKVITNYTEDERRELFSLLGGSALERYAAYSQSIESPETAASIRAVLTSSIKLFSRPDVNRLTGTKNVFKPLSLRKRPTALFIQFPERKATLLKPLSATLYWQILEHLSVSAERPVFFMLDEFPNLGQIPGFSQVAATMRSRRISITIGLQGVEQLSREYSIEEQYDILNNMKTKILFPGSTGQSGNHISEMSGETTMKTRGIEKEKSLIASDELRRLPDGYVLILAHNLNPIVLRNIPYYKDKAWATVAKSNAPPE